MPRRLVDIKKLLREVPTTPRKHTFKTIDERKAYTHHLHQILPKEELERMSKIGEWVKF